MTAILNSLNGHNFLIFQSILMTLVSKFMVYGALSDKTYLSLGLRSPLTLINSILAGKLSVITLYCQKLYFKTTLNDSLYNAVSV